MIKSMTAFAANDAEIGDLTLTCELRSVNHRYSEISCKLPERMRPIEADVRALLAEKISRGKVECSISCKKQNKDSGFVVNQEALAALLDAASVIEQKMHSAASFSALQVLSFPGIQQEPDIDKELLKQALLRLVKASLQDLLATREREGLQLKQLITERCGKMQSYATAARARLPVVLALLKQKLRDKITDLVAQPDFDRLEQELVMLTQRLDIAEELDRLETHIVEVLRVLQQSEPVGRRLDFLMQELNREANTLGSKSMDKEMTQIAIELKVLIEQMREQVQNIE